ncbi:MAG: bis-aminopropyl spermidine synthase family protein [Gammaproteobacteria bacterium]
MSETTALFDWMMCNHPVFTDCARRLCSLMDTQGDMPFDELVVTSRRPMRMVLLAFDHLRRTGRLDYGTQTHAPAPSAGTGAFSPPQDDGRRIWDAYSKMAKERIEPSLLFGQRRLVPEAAWRRAHRTRAEMVSPAGRVLFIGDDDLVSPVLAALSPGWSVEVVDIDGAVLDRVAEVATGLDTTVTCLHGSVESLPADVRGPYDVVITDPFPSGDGSFEREFWWSATTVLRPGGSLVTTVAPSHKPLAFSRGALRAMDALGFVLRAMLDGHELYEVFEFELTDLERQIIRAHSISTTISHTKTLAIANYCPGANVQQRTPFDYAAWQTQLEHHYLTIQAGLDEQRALSRARLPEIPPYQAPTDAGPGMGPELLWPSGEREALRAEIGPLTGETMQSWRTAIADRTMVELTDNDMYAIRTYTQTSRFDLDNPEVVRVALALRSIESWDRWRF